MQRGEMLRNAGILLLSIIFSLGLSEIFVRLFVKIRDVGPSYTVYDPVFGKRLKANFRAKRITPEFTMILSTNSLGFRGPEPKYAINRPILFLGDSYTLGYGVSDGQEYPALISNELNHRNIGDAQPVLNEGIGDSGNGIWLKFLNGEMAKWQPNIVVMQFSENDFDDNINENLFALTSNGSLQELPVPPAGLLRNLQGFIEAIPGLPYSYLVGLMRQVLTPSYTPQQQKNNQPLQSAEPNLHDKLTFQIAEKAISICEAHSWKILALSVGLPISRESALKEIFSRHGVSYIHIPSKIERPDLYYVIDGHWNSAGHEYVAAHVLEMLDTIDAKKPQNFIR